MRRTRIQEVVFNGQPANVQWVFIDGKVLKTRGKLVGVDHGAVVKAAQKAADRIRRDLPG
jgi:5-methylthioadenosine/S-adenosylhomocysteine deaminase